MKQYFYKCLGETFAVDAALAKDVEKFWAEQRGIAYDWRNNLWRNVATLFSDTASPYRVLLDKPPTEVDMDAIYVTFMPYTYEKGKLFVLSPKLKRVSDIYPS